MMAHIPPIEPVVLGGFGPEQRSDDIIQAIVDNNPQMIQAVRAQRNDQNIQITSLTYRSQLVEGKNYVVRVRTQGKDTNYLLLRIFQPLPNRGQPELIEMQVIQPIDFFLAE